jgi:hypothetical protein
LSDILCRDFGFLNSPLRRKNAIAAGDQCRVHAIEHPVIGLGHSRRHAEDEDAGCHAEGDAEYKPLSSVHKWRSRVRTLTGLRSVLMHRFYAKLGHRGPPYHARFAQLQRANSASRQAGWS